MSRLYSGSEIGQGYAGDEDNGETSAWWLFSAMGFYPLQMGDGHYAVGSPLFTKMTLHLDNGKTLTVNAPNNSAKNVYVTGLSVNGGSRPGVDRPLDDRQRRHGQLHDGLHADGVGYCPAAAVHHDRRPAADPARRPHRVRTGPGLRRRLGGRADRQHVAHRDDAADRAGHDVPVRRAEERGPAVHADLGYRWRHAHRLAARGVQRRPEVEGGRRPQQRDVRLAAADAPVQGQEPRSVPVLPADRDRGVGRQRLAGRARADRSARPDAERPGVRRLVCGRSRPGRHLRGDGEPVAANRRQHDHGRLEELRHLVADERRPPGRGRRSGRRRSP